VKKIKQLTMEQAPIDELRQHPHNPRQGDVGAIQQNIEQHGVYKPVVVQRSTGHILAGNHTVQAARLAGETEMPVVYLDVDDDQALRILLSDNQTSDQATNDPSILADLLENLVRSDFGLAGTGFTGDDLDEMLAEFRPELAADQVEEDEAPGLAKTLIIKPEDVWVLGQHRLVCGDSTDIETYKAILGLDRVDLVVTDPPYNVAYEGGTADQLTIQNDDMSPEEFATFLQSFFRATAEVMLPGAPIYVFHGESAGADFRQQMTESGLLLKQVLIWVKQRFVLGRQDYNWQHEPILYGWKPGAAHRWYGNFNKSTVLDDDLDPAELKKTDLVQLIQDLRQSSTIIREDRPARNGEHPTMKPVRLIARLLENSSKPNDLVLDPFGGSGSTLMACQQMNRRARLIELDPKYCDVIARRFEQATGTVPILEATGKPHSFLD